MLQYSLRRIVATVPALIGIVIVVFSILRLLPGDPAAFILGENAGGPQLLVMRHRLGLDRPLLDQFGTYLNGLAHFDLGTSLTTSLSVTSLIGHALGYTAVLAFAALIIGIVVAVPLGVVAAAAKFRGRERTDGAIMSVVMVLNNVPSFYLSLLLIMLFTDYLNILPLSGSIEWTDPGGLFLRMVMPVIALAIGTVGTLTRVVRASVVETLGEDYIRTARSLGASESTILFRHALPNAGLPIITMVGLSLGRLIAGTIIVESVFSIPGIGTQLVVAITSRDYPVVQGMVLVYALIFVVINLGTDIIYTRLDPRVRLTS